MSVYIISQLMRTNQSQLQGLRAQEYANTPSEHNAGDALICRTSGNATLADFFVTRRSQSLSSRLAPRSSNSAQGRSFQFAK